MKKIVAIIDPLISTTYLAQQLKQAGIFTIAIFRLPVSEIFVHALSNTCEFDKKIYLNNPSADNIINTLKSFSIDFILNGCELATTITDTITHRILPGIANNPNFSKLRFDKYWMQEALKNHKLPYIRQLKVIFSELINFPLNEITFPCFVKPVDGAGTVGSFYAENQGEFKENLLAIKNKIQLPSTINEYLIQEYIVGDEFFVDSFSIHGKHYISSVQKYQRQLIHNIPVLRYSEVVTDTELWHQCTNFVASVMDATGLQNGFAHTEIFKLNDGSFRLIEINPRISGGSGFANQVAQLSGLDSQIDLLAQYLTTRLVNKKTVDNIHCFVRRLYLFNWNQQPLKNPAALLNKIESLYTYKLLRDIGTINNNSQKNVLNIDAFVVLCSQNRDQIEKDSQTIFQLEQDGKLL